MVAVVARTLPFGTVTIRCLYHSAPLPSSNLNEFFDSRSNRLRRGVVGCTDGDAESGVDHVVKEVSAQLHVRLRVDRTLFVA